MKKSLSLLYGALCVLFLFSFCFFTSALPKGDDPIPIPLIPDFPIPEGGPRSLDQITASVDVESGTVYVNLLSVNETASVSLVNVNTLESYNQNAQGGYVTCLFTSGSAGVWRLVISMPSGWDYIGEFYL